MRSRPLSDARNTLAIAVLCAVACSGPRERVASVEGQLDWSIDFDAEAEAAGYADCGYTRTYFGWEDHSAPWLCPDCDLSLRADVQLAPGEACYAAISGETEAPDTERLGWTGDTFRRGPDENYLLLDFGTADVGDDRVAVAYTSEVQGFEVGTFTLALAGTLELGVRRADPMWGFTPPDEYACGWPRANPPPYDGDWVLAEGALVPDGWFLDACDEPVRLHDLLDRPLILEVAAMDCPVCQDMAEGEVDFHADLAAEGVDVRVVTLLAPSLTAVLDPTTTGDLAAWIDAFGSEDPVLADRGWGYWLGSAATGDAFGYPTVVVVDADGTVVHVQTGFGSWDDLAAIVREL